MIKLLARDAETGRMGTYQAAFTVPNLVREEKRVPISSVVLSGQRVPLGDSLYTVQQKIEAEAVDPLVYDGQKLIPSVTRVFSKSRDLYVFLQAYQRAATTTQPLVAFVTLLSRDRSRRSKRRRWRSPKGWTRRRRPFRFRFSLSVDQLPPGQYDLQVTVLDPTGQKAAFWQAPIVLIP